VSGTLVAQVFLNGILLGLIYAVLALGLSLTMGVLRIINVAHSTFILLGAYGAFVVLRTFQQDPLVAVLPLVVVFFGLGMLTERLVVRRVARSPQVAGLLALFGLMIVIESAMVLIWTTDVRALTSPIYGGSVFTVAGTFRLPAPRLFAAVMAVIALICVHLFLTRTMTGKAIRGLAQNRDHA
jgi:branched-chain amino acid transport system permease protein